MARLPVDEEGQDLVEYALLLVFFALAAIALLPQGLLSFLYSSGCLRFSILGRQEIFALVQD